MLHGPFAKLHRRVIEKRIDLHNVGGWRADGAVQEPLPGLGVSE